MLHTRQEGEKLHNGFNFYPLSDKSSFGFLFHLNKKTFWFRYSKQNKKWIIGNE